MDPTMIHERKTLGRPLATYKMGNIFSSQQLKTIRTMSSSAALSSEVDGENPMTSSLATGNSGPHDFIGRESELQKIKEFVFRHYGYDKTNNNNAVKNLIVLLFGLPVVGKTALARRLVVEFGSLYPEFHFMINMKGVSSGYITITDAMIGTVYKRRI